MNSFSNLQAVCDGRSFHAGKKTGRDRESLVDLVRNVITRINHGIDFGPGLAEEWTRCLEMVLDGFDNKLRNPYLDLASYDAEPLFESTAYDAAAKSIRPLVHVSGLPLPPPSGAARAEMAKTLLIIAVGGADSTFYGGLSRSEIHDFEKKIFPPELIQAFDAESSPVNIPRALMGKKCDSGGCVSILESVIIQAYHAGIRNVAVIGNSQTGKPLQAYLKNRLDPLIDLHWTVTVQPLLPMISFDQGKNGNPVVSPESGAYPGGHGHGFKYCLADAVVRELISKGALEYFLFSNGDNAVLFNWGAEHIAWALHEMKAAGLQPDGASLRVGFFLVWETLRKGGFAYRLSKKAADEIHVQMIENELAAESGIPLRKMKHQRAAYNTNVAMGMIQNVLPHMEGLPMALKWKISGGVRRAAFEASLSTALTVKQAPDGSSTFIPRAAMFFLPPKDLPHPHWSHISMRKRGDWFAFMSSLFKIGHLNRGVPNPFVIMTDRNAGVSHPVLEGNILDHGALDARSFFDVFKDAEIDVGGFTGVLKIDLLKDKGLPHGRLRFKGRIRLLGSGIVAITVPAGEEWTLKDRTFDSPAAITVKNG
jgi:hypothetical protein